MLGMVSISTYNSVDLEKRDPMTDTDSSPSEILLKRHGALAIITFNAPERLNAMTLSMAKEFITALRGLKNAKEDKARALLITGAGRGFCAGMSLEGDGVGDTGAILHDYFNVIVAEMSDLEIPVIAAVNGIAAGAGMSIALLADIVYAGQSAGFLQAFVNIGLVPDCGSSYLLPRLIGQARATALMMQGKKLSASKAADWGMIHAVCEDDTLMDTAMGEAKMMAEGPTLAYAGIRKLVQASGANSMADQIKLEQQIQRQCGFTDDSIQAVQAFMKKEKAVFSGE